MPTTYTTSLRLAKPATGELSGTWGDTVNNGVTSLVEQAIAGYTSIAMTDANYTLTATNGASDEARNLYIRFTGTLTASRNIIVPAVSKAYFITNATTGGYSLVVKTPSGTGVTIRSANTSIVFCDGTNVINTVNQTASLAFANAADASATRLDWYEEGTFTPTLEGDTTAGAWTYGTRTGEFTRIGNRVFFEIYIITSARTSTPSGILKITGLPYTPVGLSFCSVITNVNAAAGALPGVTGQLVGVIPATAEMLLWVNNNGTSTAYLSTAPGTSAISIGVSGCVKV